MDVKQQRKELAQKIKQYFGNPYIMPIRGHKITLFNPGNVEFSPKQLDIIEETLDYLEDLFPQIVYATDRIDISPENKPSVFGNDNIFPLSGEAFPDERSITLYPRVFEGNRWRHSDPNLPPMALLPCTIIHELTHNAVEPFIKPWIDNGFVEIDIDPTYTQLNSGPYGVYSKNGHGFLGINGRTMTPKENPTVYSTGNLHENICDSLTCFMMEPDYLKEVAPTKYKILAELAD